MNLWDKALRLGLILLVPTLFFIACEEELNNVGTDTSGNQFDLLFEEFTLPSHVIIDSVKTSEVGLLSGSYVDPEFGTLTSAAYSAFGAVTSVDLSGGNIVFDKLEFALKFTPYYYGDKSETPITFKIHELSEEITDVSNRTNFSKITYDATPLGEGSFSLIPTKYDTLELSETDTLKIELNDVYFQRMQDTLRSTRSSNTTLSISASSGFYGFAILASGSDKVVGISTGSKLSIQYHTLEDGVHKDTLRYNFSLTRERFNNITSDRLGTELAEVKDDAPSTAFFPTNNLRYIQGGTGITTEIDFQPYLDFFMDKEHVLLNSVELSFGEIKDNAGFSVPTGLSLFNTDDNSDLTTIELSTQVGVLEFPHVYSDSYSRHYVSYQDHDGLGRYSALSTQYFQDLYDNKIERTTAVMIPATISSSSLVINDGYTVDRFIVHQDSIKLKVYYTSPKK